MDAVSIPIQSSFRSSSELAGRLLTSRLRYTCTQRGAGPIEHHPTDTRSVLSFIYRVLGCSIGLREGVLLGSADPHGVAELIGIAGDVGASLLKVTRSVPGPIVHNQMRTERLDQWTIVYRSVLAREVLPLAPTYEATLAEFGKHTRRNIRNVRKDAAEAGLTFEVSTGPALISASDRVALAAKTRPKGVRLLLARRFEAHADGTTQPFRCVIRTPGGEIVSYACGYFGGPSAAYLLYQLNNPAFNALSPSLLLRAHLVQWLAERGCAELYFVHGCTGILYYACTPQPLEEILLLRRSLPGYVAASPIALAKAQSSLGRLVRAALQVSS